MPLSPDFKRAILAQTTGERDVVLFTITHPRWTDTLRLSTDQTVQNGEDPETAEPIWGTWSRGEFYRYLPISPTVPSSSDEEAPTGSVSISNVGNAVSPYLQIVDSTYPRVTVEVVSKLPSAFGCISPSCCTTAIGSLTSCTRPSVRAVVAASRASVFRVSED